MLITIRCLSFNIKGYRRFSNPLLEALRDLILSRICHYDPLMELPQLLQDLDQRTLEYREDGQLKTVSLVWTSKDLRTKEKRGVYAFVHGDRIVLQDTYFFGGLSRGHDEMVITVIPEDG